MIHVDSFALPCLLTALICVSACTSETASHGSNRDRLDLEVAEISTGVHSFAEFSEFGRICLSGTHLPEGAREIATSRGWKAAGDELLENARLGRLRKQVLSIPGGGGRFTEEQEILSMRIGDEPVILNLERRIAEGETRSTACSIYSQAEFLKTCEQVGRQIGRAPDRNQAYPERNAHFIQWHTEVEGKAATVSCSRTPQSAILPYDGTILSVLIDHSGTSRKTALKPISVQTKSNRPASGGSGR